MQTISLSYPISVFVVDPPPGGLFNDGSIQRPAKDNPEQMVFPSHVVLVVRESEDPLGMDFCICDMDEGPAKLHWIGASRCRVADVIMR